jgi:hypothetical protein
MCGAPGEPPLRVRLFILGAWSASDALSSARFGRAELARRGVVLNLHTHLALVIAVPSCLCTFMSRRLEFAFWTMVTRLAVPVTAKSG